MSRALLYSPSLEVSKLSDRRASQLCAIEMGKDQKTDRAYRDYLDRWQIQMSQMNSASYRAIENPRRIEG